MQTAEGQRQWLHQQYMEKDKWVMIYGRAIIVMPLCAHLSERFYSSVRPYQINVMFHRLFTFWEWPGRPGKKIKKVYYEMFCITKITMIAKYLEDTTSVSQPTNSTFLSHTLSCLCSMNYQRLQLYFHHMTVWFTFLFEICKMGPGWIHET